MSMEPDFLTLTIGKQKNIALIAHDGKKAELIQWCKDNRGKSRFCDFLFRSAYCSTS